MTSNKKDLMWKYEVEIVDGRKYIRCTLCNKVIRWGVYIMKEHLAGIKGNVVPCINAPLAVRDDIKSYIRNSEKVRRFNQLVQKKRIDKCITLNSRFKSTERSSSGSVTQSNRRVRGPMYRFLKSVEDDQIEELGGTRKGGIDKKLRDRT